MFLKSSPVLKHFHYVSPQYLPKLYVGASNSAAQWVIGCTSIEVSMSTEEYLTQEKAFATDITNKPGRLGVKESTALMHTHIFGSQNLEKTSLFSFYTPSGEIAKIFVDAVRFDVSNQTVFLDAAIIPSYSKTSTNIDWIVLSTMRDQKIVPLMIDPTEIPFWIHILPTLVERCRS
jgi:hypothetical protein